MHSFNPCSSNLKLGPIASTRSARSSCPSSCVFKGNGCYGDNFPLSLHWGKLDHSGLSWAELMDKVRTIPRGAIWRHNEVGDLDTVEGSTLIDPVRVYDLIQAGRGTDPIIYTHHTQTPANIALLQSARAYGLPINASCETVEQVERCLDEGVNAVLTVARGEVEKTTKLEGVRLVPCPQETRHHKLTCKDCGLCAVDRASKGVAIVFHAHGGQAKKVESALNLVRGRV